MRVLFIFLDGVGLGVDDPSINPFARAHMPTIERLLSGRKLLAHSAPTENGRATLLSIDANLGVPGLPQSATGQASLVTGVNVSAEIGEHYGPKPNAAVAKALSRGSVFSRLAQAGKVAALLNAYPPRYFRAVDSGQRLYSAIPLAVTGAGLRLFDHEDLFAHRALSADLTGEAWISMLGFPSAPVFEPTHAGELMADLAAQYDFSMFEYWSTDYAGHKQDMPWAVRQLETLDLVLAGLLKRVDQNQLILLSSDHGNMEDLSTRRHTNSPVPALTIGDSIARRSFASGLRDLTDIAPAIEKLVLSIS
jgi:2,3-bisphosphoglycerate-independent phosphoglycerate mutase